MVPIWIYLCAFLNCAGWILSTFHALNRTGYLVVLFVGAILAWRYTAARGFAGKARPVWRKWYRRFHEPLPLAFLVVAVLALIGGAIYAPNNYDALAYRVPRILHWLAAEQWHWIPTEFERINTRGCGFEWVATPIIAFTHSVRLLFLLNFISFCFLPGLIFSMLTRLGVSPRVARSWMWVLPAGYCFLLQASSLGNDLFTVPFVLAALDYGLRARQSGRSNDLWLSLLALALATGVKANTLPLGLVWLVVVAPCWRLVLRSPLRTFAVGAVCLGTSFLPMAVLNWQQSGDWTGGVAERLPFKGGAAWARIFGNVGITAISNFLPPVAPFAGTWNTRVAPALVPQSLEAPIAAAFPMSYNIFSIAEMQTEEGAGLGFGVCVLLAGSAIAALLVRRSNPTKRGSAFRQMQLWFIVAVVIATVALLRTSFVLSTARLLTPYYLPLILPLLLHPAHRFVIHRRWWRAAALAVWGLAGMLVVVSASRPLLPVQSIVRGLRSAGWSHPSLERAERVYAVYGERADAFAALRKLLPPDEPVIGVVTFDDPETSLWQPFGSRRIVHVTRKDTPETLSAKGVRYVLIDPARTEWLLDASFEAWRTRIRGEQIASQPLSLRAGGEPTTWCVVRLK
jgi:hypothetical protein